MFRHKKTERKIVMKKLLIVGAGLGAKSITLAGLEALKKADIVLYDKLVHPEIIDMVESEKVSVGKNPYAKHCIRQEDINGLIRKELELDKCVVRLKGGDSTLFARSLEEIEIADECGAVSEIIPGVTSASTLVSKLTKSLTDRRVVSGCVFITGHSKNGDCTHNWEALAKLGLTIVVYMGVKNSGYISEKLMSNGMDGMTPVVIGSKLESDEEKIKVTTLSSLEATVAEGDVPHPATIIIGNVLD
jgi:uroporphyrin-III C-methyltransferase